MTIASIGADAVWMAFIPGMLLYALGIFAASTALPAALSVAIIGPRDRDSLILPGLAAAGAVLVVGTASSWAAGVWDPNLPIAGWTTAAVTAVAQRIVGDRLTEESPHWPTFVRVGSIVACMLVGAVFGYVLTRWAGPVAFLGMSAAGATIGVIQTRPD